MANKTLAAQGKNGNSTLVNIIQNASFGKTELDM